MAQKAATLEIPESMQFLRQQLHDLPDERNPGNNTKYKVEDAMMAAFSIFFTQSESFLEHQRLMKSSKGKDNAESLFLIEKIPCDNQIRNLLDPVPAATIFMAFQEVYEWLNKNGVLNKFLYLDEEILIALDGTEYFSSQKINCPHCNSRKRDPENKSKSRIRNIGLDDYISGAFALRAKATAGHFITGKCLIIEMGVQPIFMVVSHLLWFRPIKNK